MVAYVGIVRIQVSVRVEHRDKVPVKLVQHVGGLRTGAARTSIVLRQLQNINHARVGNFD